MSSDLFLGEYAIEALENTGVSRSLFDKFQNIEDVIRLSIVDAGIVPEVRRKVQK